MKYILLNDGQNAIVDDEDYPLLSRHQWHAQKTNRGKITRYYAAVKNHSLGHLYMHSLVLPRTRGNATMVDHINGNGLDNRKVNLRLCTSSQNQANTKRRNGIYSQYKGVCYNEHTGKWFIQISTAPYKVSHIGSFATEREAALAYDLWAIDLYGEFAKTNTKVIAHS